MLAVLYMDIASDNIARIGNHAALNITEVKFGLLKKLVGSWCAGFVFGINVDIALLVLVW
jgi:hypothetical protein